MGISRLNNLRKNSVIKPKFRRIDIMFSTMREAPFGLLYFTGSGQFNVEMRNHALSLGYSLSEYGLKKEKKFVDNNGKPFETEQDIFKFLGIKYVEPKDRKGGIINDNLI